MPPASLDLHQRARSPLSRAARPDCASQQASAADVRYGVKPGLGTMSERRPLRPSQQTYVGHRGTSPTCQ